MDIPKFVNIFFFQPLHRELYTLNVSNFFVSSFRDAFNEKTEESFRSILSEPSPGIFVFEMLQPRFCEMLLAEVSSGCYVVPYASLSYMYFSFHILLSGSNCLGRKF